MNQKAQASLEYVLLIAGAVLAAAIVIIIMLGSITGTNQDINVYNNQFNILSHSV
ncbi:class III signal peptide-containing protein [Candidatus Micrarchaeota archaeon]|nr:class III signal peptide-containing protein [Candidatus Micrarchaeota archaeon]MBU2475964.1 class III signal peptide-containing protein [Candidatus Micrarchaeota archaeon]